MAKNKNCNGKDIGCIFNHSPLLTCFMVTCHMQSAQAAEPVPCHAHVSEDNTNDNGMTLVSDCMGTDFFAQNLNDSFQTNPRLGNLDFALTNATSVHNAPLINLKTIRGRHQG